MDKIRRALNGVGAMLCAASLPIAVGAGWWGWAAVDAVVMAANLACCMQQSGCPNYRRGPT